MNALHKLKDTSKLCTRMLKEGCVFLHINACSEVMEVLSVEYSVEVLCSWIVLELSFHRVVGPINEFLNYLYDSFFMAEAY